MLHNSLMKKAYINSSGPGNCYLSSQGSRVQKIVTYFNLRRKIKCYARWRKFWLVSTTCQWQRMNKHQFSHMLISREKLFKPWNNHSNPIVKCKRRQNISGLGNTQTNSDIFKWCKCNLSIVKHVNCKHWREQSSESKYDTWVKANKSVFSWKPAQ